MKIEPISFGEHHWSYQSFVNELSNPGGHYFVACNNTVEANGLSLHQITGYTGFWLIGDEAHITTLAVHPDYRRQHIGEKLLIYDIKQAQKVGANWITLEVRASNQSAQSLYFKYGFKSLGTRRNYYQDNLEDAIVLWTDNISSSAFKHLINKRMSEQYPDASGVPQSKLLSNSHRHERD